MIDLHEKTTAQQSAGRPDEPAEDRGKAEIRIGDTTSTTPFRHGLEYTPPARGTWTIAHTPMLVPGSHEIFVCPEGCLRGVVLSAAEFGGLDRFHMVTVKEKDLYNDAMDDLFIEGISQILNELPELPPAVFVFSSCIHHFLGTDLDRIFRELRSRFPGVDFIEASMNCTLRNSKLNYEEATNRQLYAGLDDRPKNPKALDIIGNYFALDNKSEVYSMLEEAGFTVRDLCRAETYDDYKAMSEASYALYTQPLGKVAADELHRRLQMQPVYVPYSWDYFEIDNGLQRLADTTGAAMPNTEMLRMTADMALLNLVKKMGRMEIQIDAAATPRPFGLAKLLLTHGFNVTTVYADAVPPGDEAAFDYLKVNLPELKMRAITNFRCRTWPRDEAEKDDGQLLAIGQKATYFTGTNHFVNMIFNSGLIGYTGIIRLTSLMEDAVMDEKSARDLIQIKAWGCHG